MSDGSNETLKNVLTVEQGLVSRTQPDEIEIRTPNFQFWQKFETFWRLS